METTSARGSSDLYRTSSGGSGGNRRFGGLQFSPSSFMQAPVSALLEYTGVLRPVTSRLNHSESESLISGGDVGSTVLRDHGSVRTDDPGASGSGGGGEVSIRIIGLGDQDNLAEGGGDGATRPLPAVVSGRERSVVGGNSAVITEHNTVIADRADVDGENVAREGISPSSSYTSSDASVGAEGDAGNTTGANSRDGAYQRYDIQQVARWIEQILPFSLLLLVVFIRQHLQGFFVTIWIAAVMFKSNDILRKQTALKGERKICVLVAFAFAFTLHVAGVYWWYRNDDLVYPLFMLPPKVIPPFWHAIFIIMVNDTMVRQAVMILKCMLLMYYKNTRGRNHRRQGQMLTLVEYMLLLYRALLPAPVWYRFFLNKEYGSLFSSLTTGLYLTFKLTSVVEKVQSFITAFRALSRREVQYGSHATSEQVIAAGDLCAICQEKMHTPILLRCKHIFCEDCVSEWFERERTCPLCRALVKPAELRSFGDGSTSLYFQLF